MADNADYYNNTIANTLLMPTTDSFAKREELAYNPKGLDEKTREKSFKGHAQTVNKEKRTVHVNEFKVFVNGSKDPLANLSKVEGFSISRAVENKSIGGFSQYVVKLPGGLSYEPVTFNRFDFSSVAFFKWLTNGINQGGIQTADFSIRVGTESDYIRFVLKEAFPISWKLAEIIPQAENDPLIRMESLTIVYKTLELQHLDPDEK